MLRFRLRFNETPAEAKQVIDITEDRAEANRQSRPFDPLLAPKTPTAPADRANPEETQALREKAVRGHHDLLVALADWLQAESWQCIEEIPLAVDLWAIAPAGERVIFEAKTVHSGSEGPRVRSAIAQLLEYRFFFGNPEDRLCLVCDRPLSGKRVKLLDGLGISVLWRSGETFHRGSATSLT